MARTSRRHAGTTRTVQIVPGWQKEDGTWHSGVSGTLKTVLGYTVVEVHKGYYFRPDLNVQAVRYYKDEDGMSGWVVSDDRDKSYSDPIPTKEEALHVLTFWKDGK